MFWWANLWNIWFLEPMFMKHEKQLLMWKVICVSCTLSRLPFLCRVCPFGYLGQQHLQAMLAWVEIEPVENSKIKIWASHKNTLADGSFFTLSHLILIPLIFLHSVTEAIWDSHKNTLATSSFFSLSYLIPIPLIFLHSVTKAIWASHKNTLATGFFFPLSHLIPIPLIFLHSITEAKQRTV